MWPFIYKEILTTKGIIAQKLGVNSKNVALTENISSGMILPFWGIKVVEGEELLISDCEHPGVVAASREFCRRNKLIFKILPIQKIKNLNDENIILEISKNIETPIRKFGSASLDLANVACGRFDGFWQRELSYWDIAAGIIIVKEAGGFIEFLDKDVLLEATTFDFKIDNLNWANQYLIKSDYQKRKKIKGISKMRAKMIVIASIFVQYIIEKSEIKNVKLSTFSLKEGVVFMEINN